MIDPRVRLAFFSKPPHATRWLEIHSPEGAEPEDLFRDLAVIGWEPERFPPPPTNWSRLTGDVDYKVIERQFIRHGTGLFRAWTPEETPLFLADVRALLRAYGFSKVPIHKLRLEDLL